MARKGQKFNKYTYEFKKNMCERYLSGQHGGGQTFCRKFGIRNRNQLYAWLNLYRKDPKLLKEDGRGKASSADGVNKGRPKQIDLSSLSKDEQIDYLKMENDILKKAKALRKSYGEH